MGEMIEESRRVARGAAGRVRVEIAMGSGELAITGGASGLLDANFRYNVPEWRPAITYAEADGRGVLRLEQPQGGGAQVRNARQRWELRLAPDVPIDLAIAVGTIEGNLLLGPLALGALDIESGTASLVLDFSAARAPFDATIQGGVINATLRLPATVGARVGVRVPLTTINGGGLRRIDGDYVNGAYDAAAGAARVRIEGGVANLILAGR